MFLLLFYGTNERTNDRREAPMQTGTFVRTQNTDCSNLPPNVELIQQRYRAIVGIRRDGEGWPTTNGRSERARLNLRAHGVEGGKERGGQPLRRDRPLWGALLGPCTGTSVRKVHICADYLHVYDASGTLGSR